MAQISVAAEELDNTRDQPLRLQPYARQMVQRARLLMVMIDEQKDNLAELIEIKEELARLLVHNDASIGSYRGRPWIRLHGRARRGLDQEKLKLKYPDVFKDCQTTARWVEMEIL